ncbi:MAG TPA: LPS-assembly protein LptD [Burkholderiales bacterium]|nr:LPS-assembly protein LptD [Burkholderiales bacterium]
MRLAILRTATAAAAVALASVAAPGGEARAQGQGLRLERSLGAAPSGRSDDLPTFVTADRIEGLGSAEVEASGDVELRRGDTSIRADRMRYFQETDEAEAVGNVRIRIGEDQATGPRLRLRLGDTTGIFEEPEFHVAPRTVRSRLKRGLPVGAAIATGRPGESALLVETEGRGQAKAFRFEGEERYRVTDGSFTTCKPGQDDWFISARELDLDFERDVGTARDARLTFLGVTTPNIPWFDFSLSNERKSGFLPPTAGYQNKTGFEFLQPFYWNIAPNYDATISARYMSQRGLQFLNEFRFLQPYFRGEARYDILPDDSQTHTSRWAQLLTTNFNYQNGWTGLINYQKVSDDNYFRDLSPRIAIATQTYLTQQAAVNYSSPSGWWSAAANYQRFQTLQDPQNPVPLPYFREPQLTLNALRQTLGGLDVGLQSEFVNFGNSNLVPTGARATAYPSVAWPNVTSYGFVTPKVGVSATIYDLDTLGAFPDKTPSRVLPIASVDSGLYLEREARWFGSDYLQTLEPRAYYLYVPFRNQTNLPIFDTTTTDLNYSQLFQENIFVGGDRIANANQLSLGAVSRLIRPRDGQEMVRAVIGQRYYFADQLVFIPGQPVRTSNVSPLIVGLAGRIAPDWTAEVGAQYQFADPSGFARFTSGVRYSPAPASVVSLAYRYVNQNYTAGAGTIETVDLAGQWPLGRGFYGVARYSYDLAGSKPVDTLIGLEYNAGCWILRAVAQKFQTSTTQNTALFFLQIEFNGLARVGSDPLEVLRRSIPGYTLINQAAPDPSLRDFGSGGGVTGPVDVNSRVQPIRSDTPSTYRTYE